MQQSKTGASQDQIRSLLNEVPALKVWKCIKDNGGMDYKEIMKTTKIPQATVFRMIKTLSELNLIESEKWHVASKKPHVPRYGTLYFSKVRWIKL